MEEVASNKKKVCHLTSVHPPFDIRIFYKECVSLSNNGYAVKLIAPFTQAISKHGIDIIPINLPKSRLKRMLLVTPRMLNIAIKQNASIYHFHDPELMFCGVLLKLRGKKVVFDIHENVRLSLVSKDWINPLLGRFFAWIYYIIERFALLFFDHLIFAEDSYQKYYPKKNTTVILNYPLPKDNVALNVLNPVEYRFVYSGVVHKLRGVMEMVDLLAEINRRGFNCVLDIIGELRPESLNEDLATKIKAKQMEEKIRIHGKVDFSEVSAYLSKANFGLSFLKPIPNYKESLPTKIFEYMQNGLVVITNDFPLYKAYVEENKVGICENIGDMMRVADRLEALFLEPNIIDSMAKTGKELVRVQWNWNSQEKKMLEVYRKLIN